jgi:uncharacterized protein YegP (UPF0339 family)
MIKILNSEDGRFYFVVVAKNGRILATSQMFVRKDNAITGATALLTVAAVAEIKDMTAA